MGDGVFETLYAHKGTPFRLDAHLDRLEQGAGPA
jgi:branched-subunit amino acid aminotransferase/4-amino-4-deoxychorismate lyase